MLPSPARPRSQPSATRTQRAPGNEDALGVARCALLSRHRARSGRQFSRRMGFTLETAQRQQGLISSVKLGAVRSGAIVRFIVLYGAPCRHEAGPKGSARAARSDAEEQYVLAHWCPLWQEQGLDAYIPYEEDEG